MTHARRPIVAPLLAAVFALASSAAAARAQTESRSRVDTTFAFSKNGSVDLGLVSGEIIVSGWTRPEARVVASIERGYFETSLSSGRISMQVRSRRGGVGEARYQVTVPIGVRVQANAVSGNIRIKATAGEVQANTVSGDVEVLDAADRITIQSVSGDVHAGKLRGRTRIDVTSADVQIEDVSGDVVAKTVSGEISIRNAKSSQVHAETVSGEITYGGTIEKDGSYEFSAHSGDIRLEIPAGAGATLELQTFSGSISSRFPITLQPGDRSRSRHGKRMEFTIGDGGARISAETFSGDITIERNTRSGRED